MYSINNGEVLPVPLPVTETQARAIIERYYRDDPEGMESDRQITLQRGETIQQWAESLLDPIT